MDYIKIRGARQHNLKNINLDIPKNKLVVITGISGSGKSSLAFDTIYAEGQRRYVESLSAYARQFLGIMDKPDVDLIEGLSPSISIDQKMASHNPRSTVGTITEIYDYLRLLFARIGHPHCSHCGREISRLTVDEITDRLVLQIEKEVGRDKVIPHKFYVYSPVVRDKKGEFKSLFENLKSKGFSQVKVDNNIYNLDQEIDLIKTNKHSVYVLVKYLSETYKNFKKEDYRKALGLELKSIVEQCLALSDGLLILNSGNKDSLYSEKFSCPNCNLSIPEIEPRMFSFNSPLGACKKCHGIGTIFQVDPELIINKNLSVNEGGILPFNKLFFHETWFIRVLKTALIEEGINLEKPLGELNKKQLEILLHGTGKVYQVFGKNRFGRQTVIYEKFNGIIDELERRYFENQQGYPEIDKYIREVVCPSCHGYRLTPEILSITVNGLNIWEISQFSVDKLLIYFEKEFRLQLNSYEAQISKPIIKEMLTRLIFLKNVGLSYLSIDRTARSLAGGELQRIRLASQIGTGLTGVLYVLDEPSIGLHARDVNALINTLKKLRDLGNSVIVVEHDWETIEAADHLIELGPKAGKNGGAIVYQGNVNQMKKNSKSLTGSYLSGRRTINFKPRALNKNQGRLILTNIAENNLKKINFDIPLGNLVAVTGVSGSGKSSLVVETLYPALRYYLEGYYQKHIGKFDRLEGYQYLDRVLLVDQSPIGRTPRSNAATYVGFFDQIRDTFAATIDARSKGFKKGRFSFNVKGGRCEKCQGAGVIKVEMQFLADIYVTCDVCQGKRYNQETLGIMFKNKTIYDVLKFTVDETINFFAHDQYIVKKLLLLQDVGLGYIELGQGAPTFSGGEAQRIKLAAELSKKNTGRTLYILDEPTTGLHFFDIEKLINVLNQLVDMGNTVIIIEHNLDVIKNCQYIIDLGPEGGEKGGKIMYQGLTEGIIKEQKSYTGEYLQKILNNKY
ncbi:excinuclease ABC subunit UvrA [Candidatus Roizmanbacteria bacterium CG10_big_fil_rev_8_21_14_0_10_36_26]|uniref:UvrABC system protein A n=2 Tax=Candidatus Roizmaniibacteriota TaxID=1752723 RepID=A0A2M8KMG8_9BACT|nr:MAG: excinuclease ABC subunit UvrA [Candidatus Roizmanbacteria bacterium CG_4_9_14_3_um_filter_36_11]PJE61108.1 MAG: excinuclease ABC subunit UvrA [Candidatus Roizmanbacteria bacterium CG10_big_fil_rev_8_21_14_0_10_36_26]